MLNIPVPAPSIWTSWGSGYGRPVLSNAVATTGNNSMQENAPAALGFNDFYDLKAGAVYRIAAWAQTLGRLAEPAFGCAIRRTQAAPVMARARQLPPVGRISPSPLSPQIGRAWAATCVTTAVWARCIGTISGGRVIVLKSSYLKGDRLIGIEAKQVMDRGGAFVLGNGEYAAPWVAYTLDLDTLAKYW